MGGPIGETAAMQATLGVKEGGLGFRRVRGLALLAFVSSRVGSRWIVEKLAHGENLLNKFSNDILTAYDEETTAAIHHFQQELPESARANVKNIIDDFQSSKVEIGKDRPSRFLLYQVMVWLCQLVLRTVSSKLGITSNPNYAA